MTSYAKIAEQLPRSPHRWLVTGVAGFIGSHLLETLLRLEQNVVGLDNFATGHQSNLEQVQAAVSPAQWRRFEFIAGSITDQETCARACRGVEVVLHEAALGSVPYSIEHPLETHQVNVSGFVNILAAARQAGVSRVVYASSSAVYGDDSTLPKQEARIGKPLSPYAATKWINEIYADSFARSYGLECVGLRYFNVFGPRQDPNGAYAAVIPKWIASLLAEAAIQINGDGETSRDFCHVANVVAANILAATCTHPAALNQVFNIALGQRTTLNELFRQLTECLQRREPGLATRPPIHAPERAGDIRHSLADISKARELLGYQPGVNVADGLERAMDWYRAHLRCK